MRSPECPNQDEWDERKFGTYVSEDVPTGWTNLIEKDHLEDISIDGKTIRKLILNELSERAWTRWSWLRTGTGGGLLRTW
jgi:hypothetical protein